MRRHAFFGISLLGIVLTTSVPPVAAAPQLWTATDATATLSLDPVHLAGLGLEVVDARATSSRFEARELLLEPPVYSFEAAPGPPGLPGDIVDRERAGQMLPYEAHGAGHRGIRHGQHIRASTHDDADGRGEVIPDLDGDTVPAGLTARATRYSP